MMAESEWVRLGSALTWTVSFMTKGSWGMAIILVRMVSRGMVRRFRPSMMMVPESISMRRRRARRRELLPLLDVRDGLHNHFCI
jgi:hypothetical protein